MLVTPPLCSTKSMFCSFGRLNFQLSLVQSVSEIILSSRRCGAPRNTLEEQSTHLYCWLNFTMPNQQPATSNQRAEGAFFPPVYLYLCSSCTLDGSIKIQLFFVYSPPLFLYLYSSCTRYGSVKIQFFFFFNSRSQHLL